MAQVFPAQRNFKFSSSLMNLKFMKRSEETETKNPLSDRERTKSKAGPALTQLEANRREMEARTQLANYVAVEEEFSFCRLYDLVSGRFDFRKKDDPEDATLSKDAVEEERRKRNEDAEDGEMQSDDDKKDLTEDDASGQISKSQGGRYFTAYTKSARFAEARKRRQGKDSKQRRKRNRNNEN
ncbi:uncharacterized protein LOC129593507 [Paramacrobiotus metropolitanus]|uniref:uncharacterized protein LOC129593507 n=1 Tax=Paramacrobiotus metropolitanus TaxID=2943436 RepID=UPI002445A8F2|nr:uncharacterized protein LOC129593507 [Paramacrobiotus metropolitanus]XP_055345829.1 uncharacterized protein LOC129593507 [Paramacrobiotus metropolitanus]